MDLELAYGIDRANQIVLHFLPLPCNGLPTKIQSALGILTFVSMTTGNINLFNSLLLIGVSGYIYHISSYEASLGIVLLGMILMVMSQGVRAENLGQTRVCAAVTMMAVPACIALFVFFLNRKNAPMYYLSILMAVSSLVSTIGFLLWFSRRRARRKKNKALAKVRSSQM